MFTKTVKRQGEKIVALTEENKTLYEENKELRNEKEDLELQKYHSKILAQDTLELLDILQDIEEQGNSEETKRKNRNIIINNLRKRNIDIIKELATNETY